MMQSKRLKADGLSVGYGGKLILEDFSFEITPGEITAIVGANACGKSTLLRTLSRLLVPKAGQVLLEGRSIHQMSPRDLARQMGLLPQSPLAPEGITVLDLVSRGRHPHQNLFSRWSSADDDAVAQALEATGLASFADRDVDVLSGGQRQRVWIAMALAQQTGILLLDEPTTYLDIAHQIDVLELLCALNETRGTTIVMVLHDLNLAARYADILAAMVKGRLDCIGSPAQILTETMVERVFGLPCHVMTDPTSGKPMMLPLGSGRSRGPDRRAV